MSIPRQELQPQTSLPSIDMGQTWPNSYLGMVLRHFEQSFSVDPKRPADFRTGYLGSTPVGIQKESGGLSLTFQVMRASADDFAADCSRLHMPDYLKEALVECLRNHHAHGTPIKLFILGGTSLRLIAANDKEVIDPSFRPKLMDKILESIKPKPERQIGQPARQPMPTVTQQAVEHAPEKPTTQPKPYHSWQLAVAGGQSYWVQVLMHANTTSSQPKEENPNGNSKKVPYGIRHPENRHPGRGSMERRHKNKKAEASRKTDKKKK